MGREVFVIGGLPFVEATDTTFEQDAWLMRHMRESGTHQRIEAGEDVLAAVLASGRVTHFLAGMLVRRDSEWTPAQAEETAAMFAKLRAPEEKQLLLAMLSKIVQGFFGAGASSSPSSPTASASQESSEAAASELTPVSNPPSDPPAPDTPSSPPSRPSFRKRPVRKRPPPPVPPTSPADGTPPGTGSSPSLGTTTGSA